MMFVPYTAKEVIDMRSPHVTREKLQVCRKMCDDYDRTSPQSWPLTEQIRHLADWIEKHLGQEARHGASNVG